MTDPIASLGGRVALVTGGSGGLGREICRQLAAAGAHVAVGYLNGASEAKRLVAEIVAGGGTAVAVRGDVSVPDEAIGLVTTTSAELGPIDVLVSNAGRVEINSLAALDAATWDLTMAEHLRAAFLLSQAVIPGMRERGWGRLLFMSSGAAYAGGFVGPHYAAAKAGVLGLMHWLAMHHAADGITANAIAPALIDTAVLGGPERRQSLLKRVPMGRFGTPVENAALIVAMVQNAYLNGQTISLDGGQRPN